MEKIVFTAVMLKTTAPINKKDLFIVWSCYILGNYKFMVGCKNNNLYFEVTYNKNEGEWYIDEYEEVNHSRISNDNLENKLY